MGLEQRLHRRVEVGGPLLLRKWRKWHSFALGRELPFGSSGEWLRLLVRGCKPVARDTCSYAVGPGPQAVNARGIQYDPWMLWNRSAIRMRRPSEMRYSVSMEAEFLPSSICDR